MYCTDPAKGRWGWMSQIYDETRHLSGLDRSRAIVERCADCGISAPAKHINLVKNNPLPKVPFPTSPIPTNNSNNGLYSAVGMGVFALGLLGFAMWRKHKNG